eukprot:15470300-Alexandrium_andersonii.AAC.1
MAFLNVAWESGQAATAPTLCSTGETGRSRSRGRNELHDSGPNPGTWTHFSLYALLSMAEPGRLRLP